SDVLIFKLLIHLQFKNLGCYIPCFIRIRQSTINRNALTLLIGRPDIFFQLVADLGDDLIGRSYNGLGRTVILLKRNNFSVRIILLKRKYIADVCSPERVYTLGIVPYYTKIFIT